jgi:hypothetical protein
MSASVVYVHGRTRRDGAILPRELYQGHARSDLVRRKRLAARALH